MTDDRTTPTRRTLLAGLTASAAALAGCNSTPESPKTETTVATGYGGSPTTEEPTPTATTTTTSTTATTTESTTETTKTTTETTAAAVEYAQQGYGQYGYGGVR